MRTVLTISVLVTVFSAATGQITYTDEHLPVMEWVVIGHFGEPTTNEGIITPPGSNPQVWDFTDVLESPTTDVQEFESPENAAGFEYFPNATMAYQPFLGDTSIFSFATFYQKTDSGLYVHGDYGSHIDYEESIYSYSVSEYSGYLEIPANISYGGIRSENLRAEYLNIHDTPTEQYAIRTVSYRNISYECDAWGTMYTPVYPDGVEVLRIKSQFGNQIIDSVFVDTTHTGLGEWMLSTVDTLTFENNLPNYRFMQCDSLNPFVALAHEAAGPITLAYFGDVQTPVRENNPGELSIFPNPVTKGTVNVLFGQQQGSFLKVMDLSGTVLFEEAIQGASSYTLDTHNLPSGVLILQLYNRNGALQATERLVNVR